MKTKALILFQILAILWGSLGCKKTDAPMSLPSVNNPDNPAPTVARYFLVNADNEIIAEQITTIFDGRLFKFTEGPYFILSGRHDYENAFSAALPMQNQSTYFGMNCKFKNDDCSGPCLIDANHGAPLVNSLLIANEPEHLFGKADRVYHYTSQELKTEVVQTNSRLELYGFGPYCQKIDSILDRYYSLENVSGTRPDLHNTDLRIISEP